MTKETGFLLRDCWLKLDIYEKPGFWLLGRRLFRYSSRGKTKIKSVSRSSQV